MTATHGHSRARQVPQIPGTNPKVCPKCNNWFAAAKNERNCFACIPAETRTLRALKAHRTGTRVTTGKPAGQDRVKTGFVQVYSEYLGLTFRCPATDPRAKTLLCRVLAYETAARERWNGK